MARCSATAISATVADPLALSFAPGSCTCAAMTMRSEGRETPGSSAISIRAGRPVKLLAIVTRDFKAPAARRLRIVAAARGDALNANDCFSLSYGIDDHCR